MLSYLTEQEQALIRQFRRDEQVYKQLAAGTKAAKKIDTLYLDFAIAVRNFSTAMSSTVLTPQKKNVTNIYMQDGRVVGVDHRDHEREYWEQQRYETIESQPIAAAELSEVIKKLDTALNSIVKIKNYRLQNPPPPPPPSAAPSTEKDSDVGLTIWIILSFVVSIFGGIGIYLALDVEIPLVCLLIVAVIWGITFGLPNYLYWKTYEKRMAKKAKKAQKKQSEGTKVI